MEDHQVDIILYNNYTRRKDMEYIPLAQDYLLLVLPPNPPCILKAQWCGLPWPVLDLRELVWERFLLLPEDHSIRHQNRPAVSSVGHLSHLYRNVQPHRNCGAAGCPAGLV